MAQSGAGVSKNVEEGKEGGGTKRVIRFGVAENWSAQNLLDFLRYVDDLYCFISYVNELRKVFGEDANPYGSNEFYKLQHLVQERRSYYLGPGLQIKRLVYSSPGNFDFLGLGEVVGHLKDYLLETKRIRLLTRKRELEDELLEQEIRSRIEETKRQKLENDRLIEEIEERRLANRHKKQEFHDAEERRQLELERLRIENLTFKRTKELDDTISELRTKRYSEKDQLEKESASNLLEVLGNDELAYLNSYQIAHFLWNIQYEIGRFFDDGKITDIQLQSEDREE